MPLSTISTFHLLGNLKHCFLVSTVSFSIRLHIFSSFFPSGDIPSILNSRAVDPDSVNPDPDTDPDSAFQVNPDPVRIQGFFWWPKTEEKTQMKNLWSKIAFWDFRPEKRISSASMFVGHFCPPGSRSGLRIRIDSSAELDLEITQGLDPSLVFVCEFRLRRRRLSPRPGPSAFKKLNLLMGHFYPPGSGSGSRIRIHSTAELDWR